MDTVAGNIAEEAAKDAAEDTAAGAAKATGETSAEGASDGPAGEAGKVSAEEEVVGDQPPSSSTSGPGRYLKVGDDLFIHLPGASSRAPAEGEVFDGEVLAATGLKVVDEPGVGGDGSPEEQLFRAMGPISGSSKCSAVPAWTRSSPGWRQWTTRRWTSRLASLRRRPGSTRLARSRGPFRRSWPSAMWSSP